MQNDQKQAIPANLPEETVKDPQPTKKANTANLLATVGITDFVPFRPVPTSEETANKPVGTRREWRIKKSTGELRGVSIRERNKGRKPVGWIDSRSTGWDGILASYERWRRTARYAVGNLEQPAKRLVGNQ